MSGTITSKLRARPALDPAWRRRIAEQLLAGVPRDTVVAALVHRQCPPAIAEQEVRAAEDSPYLAVAAHLRDRLAKRDWHLAQIARHAAIGEADATLPRRHRLPAKRFLAEHYRPQRPALLADLVAHWPALRSWSIDHVAALCGDPEIEAQQGRTDDPDYEINSASHRRRMPLSRLLDAMRNGQGNDLYLTANNGGHNRAALAPLWNEIGDIPGYLVPEEGRDGFLWMGPAGTITPWHHDLTNNLIVQIVGRKRVHLVSSAETPLMRNHHHCFSRYGTDAALGGAGEGGRPRLLTCLLEPGDALFIPVGWWHHVEALEPTIGMSFTNFAWPNDAATGYSTYGPV